MDLNPSRLQNRIAQKYVENCALLTGWERYPPLNNRKFDVREWVLVDSVSRGVYRFSSSYLRFCSEPYGLDRLKEERKHLTNYYVNRSHFTANEEWSVLPTA